MPSHHMDTNLIFCLFADGFFLKLGTQELFPRKIIEWGKNWQLPLKLKPEIILSALFVFASTSSNDWKEVLKGELKEWMSQESEIMNQYLVGIRNNEPISYIVSIERRWRKICTCKKISIALKKKKLCRGAPVDTHTHSTLSPFDSAAIIWSHRMKFQSSLPFDVEGAESLARGKRQTFSTFKGITELKELQSGSRCTLHLIVPASLWSKPALSQAHGKLPFTDHFLSVCSPFCTVREKWTKGSPKGWEQD